MDTVEYGPFAEWCEGLVEERREAGDRAPAQSAALYLGVSERTLNRYRRQVNKNEQHAEEIELDIVDAALTHAGLTLADVKGYEHLCVVDTMYDRFCTGCHEIVTTSGDFLCPWCESRTTDPPQRPKRYCPSCDRMIHPTNQDKCWRCLGDTDSGPPWVPCACGCEMQIPKFDAHGRSRRFADDHNRWETGRNQGEVALEPFADWLEEELRRMDPLDALASRTSMTREEVLYVLNRRGESIGRAVVQRALWQAARAGQRNNRQPRADAVGFYELYPNDRLRCPKCGGRKSAQAAQCAACRKAEGGPNGGYKRRLTEGVMEEARRLYYDHGYGIADIAREVIDRTPYKGPESLAQALRGEFKDRGWPLRKGRAPRRAA